MSSRGRGRSHRHDRHDDDHGKHGRGRHDDFLLGTSGDDNLNGGRGNDVVIGKDGDDTLKGGRGKDVLFGGDDDDMLFGGRGNDVLFGGDGDDVLKGGRGKDILFGGDGADTFEFSGHFGHDLIKDLSGDDIIDLTSFTSITSLSQLTFEQNAFGTTIYVPGGGKITVAGLTIAEVVGLIAVACLLRGTKVQTPDGEVAVEKLKIGDLVTTVDGKAKPVKWIGKRRYEGEFAKSNPKIAPVLFKAGALGANTPVRDLRVSPEHAVLVDHVLVPAELLVNGTTIRVDNTCDTVEYFHLEFDAPEVIFTNGAPTESYVDHGNRRMFQNYQDYVDLYGEEEISGKQRARRFYSIYGGAALDAIRSRLNCEAEAVSKVA